MPHEPKLTVYTIKLSPTDSCPPGYHTNKWLFRNLINEANTTPLENSFIYTEVFKRFITSLDNPEMYSDISSKKCITANQPNIEEESVNANLFVHSQEFVIEGKVEGGTYGRKRNKTSIENKTLRVGVSERDAITEDFYFFLYAPLTSNKSILMVQSYSDDTIDSVMKKFWKDFFSFHSVFNKPTIQRYVPQKIIDDFKINSTVSNLTFKTDIAGETLLEDPSIAIENRFRVTVQITPLNGNLTIEEFEKTNRSLQEKFFSRFRLGQFSKKTATLNDDTTDKKTQFELDSSFNIEPVILLSKYIQVNNEEIFFSRTKEFCFELLESIKDEIYNSNAIRER